MYSNLLVRSFVSSVALGLILSGPAFAATLLSDQTLDGIYFSSDANDDGDANDIGETSLFFGEGNDSALTTPAGNVFSMSQADSGDVYIGDGSTDTVYRLLDTNGDNDAMDAGEAAVWFSADNAEGHSLLTPNGISVGADGAIYVVQADTSGSPTGDVVYRTEDLNGDGDANDAGESSVWLDLTELNSSSSPFEIRFDGDTAYIIDTVGTDSDVIYRAQDTDGNGTIDSSEVNSFIDEDNALGVTFDFALDTNDGQVFVYDLLGAFNLGIFEFDPNRLFALEDLDFSGTIDSASEASEIWNTSFLPEGFEAGAGFSITVDDSGIFITSNGGSGAPEEDNVFHLVDLNGDGDFFDEGETTIWLSLVDNGEFPIRARSVIGYESPAPVPLPASLPLLIAGLGGLSALRRRRRT